MKTAHQSRFVSHKTSEKPRENMLSVHRPPPLRVDYTPYLSFFLRSDYSDRQCRERERENEHSQSINYFLRPVPEVPPAPSREPCRLTSSRVSDEKTEVVENRACSRLNARTHARPRRVTLIKRKRESLPSTRGSCP